MKVFVGKLHFSFFTLLLFNPIYLKHTFKLSQHNTKVKIVMIDKDKVKTFKMLSHKP